MRPSFLYTTEYSPLGDEGMNMHYGAHPLIFKKAEELRNKMTHAEELLWNYLKSNEWNLKFRRQHPLSIYVADFYCHQLRLVIEIDGSIHEKEDVKRNDAERERNLREFGLTILRFKNEQVITKPEYVLQQIKVNIIRLQKLLLTTKSQQDSSNSPLQGPGASVSVLSPATVANIVCGFDILGFALNEPCDELKVEIVDEPGVHIINDDEYDLPTEPERNVSGASLLALLDETKDIRGFMLTSKKNIKPGSGIGSSAASAAGAVLAANVLLGNRYSKEDLVRFAMNGEKVACGVKHADNIAPCLYGGITLIRSILPLDIVTLDAPPLHVTVVHPQIEVRTSDARQILKQQVQLKDAIRQWGNIAGLVAGFIKHDYDLISRSLEDVIIEPIRSILIPGFDEVKKNSKEAGALGGGISGSGPSIFMLSKDAETAKSVESAMKEVFEKLGIAYHTHVTTINKEGVKVL
ncbi:MAG TPA: homoserine kinase [Parafilimonas sp.]|nr:homoserine kinase [Parafilimonas sp.]